MRKPTNGFTLIEILLSIGIIGILAVVMIPNLLQVRQKANDVAADSIGRQVLSAMAATEASNIAGILPSCTYTNASVSVKAGGELANVNAPLPLTNVSCENVAVSLTTAAQYKVSIAYLGGTEATRTYLSYK